MSEANRSPIAALRPTRVAVRLYNWSAWCRQVIRGVQRFALDQRGWRIYVDVGPAGSGRVLNYAATWDGIITAVLQRANAAAYRRLIRTADTPVVAISASVPRALSELPAVRVDDDKVAQAIGRHLLSGGFRQLAFFGGMAVDAVDHRASGVLAFAAAHGLPCETYHDVGASPRATHAAVVRWIRRLPKPVGVITWNMDVARRVVEACRAAEVEVPSQVAVVAWDDDPLLAETLEPTISAIVLPAERLGYEAARRLATLLADRRAGRPTSAMPPLLVQPSGVLLVRQSSDVSTLADRDVHLAAQYIREHGVEAVRIADIVSAVRVSRRKLEQDFRRVTGRTLHEAVQEVRLERAKQLLLETDWPLARVAERSGMGTRTTLYDVFDRSEGMTPTEYRDRFGFT